MCRSLAELKASFEGNFRVKVRTIIMALHCVMFRVMKSIYSFIHSSILDSDRSTIFFFSFLYFSFFFSRQIVRISNCFKLGMQNGHFDFIFLHFTDTYVQLSGKNDNIVEVARVVKALLACKKLTNTNNNSYATRGLCLFQR